jgi:hypothetical protein
MGPYIFYAISYANCKGFMGQTTSFNANLIKSNVLVMGLASLMARHDISRRKGKGMFTLWWP